MEEMTKRERVLAALKGDTVDRVPLSFFGHNRQAERTTNTNAVFLINQNRKFGWDFIKINLSSSYYGEAWGCKYRWDAKRSPAEGLLIVNPIIKTAEDFKKLPRIAPTNDVLIDQIKVAKLLSEELKGSVFCAHTIFAPLTIAGFLAGSVARHPSELVLIRKIMRENPEALHEGLSTISQSMADYAREAIRAGADGIFMTNTTWTRDVVTEDEYMAFGVPYDLPIFEAAKQEGAAFNIMHMCRENIMFNILSDYPVEILSYDNVNPRNPSLSEALVKTDKALWAGIRPKTLLNGPVEAIQDEVRDALEQTMGRRFLLGPCCSISYKVPDAHLIAAKEALPVW